MKDFKPIWAKKAQAKAVTREDAIERCVLKAMYAKTDHPEELVESFLRCAFQPLKYVAPPANYASAITGTGKLYRRFTHSKSRDVLMASQVLENADEWDTYNALLIKATEWRGR